MHITTLYSRVTDQGTAMSEATLCAEHYTDKNRAAYDAVASASNDASADTSWHETTDNDAVSCQECSVVAA